MNSTLERILYPIRNVTAAARLRGQSLEHTMIHKAANLVAAEKIEGDYLEFGVYSGGSFIQSYHAIRKVFSRRQKRHGPERSEKDKMEIERLWQAMRFFAFDSFQGLPEPDGIDRQSRDFVKGKYRSTEGAFRRNLSLAGISLSKVVTVTGSFKNTCTEETIRKYEMNHAAIIHVDCDLYASARLALEFVTPLLTDGTIIIFDDWFCFRGNPNFGEQKAFNEWLVTLPDWSFAQYQKEGPWGNSFIANKRNPAELQATQ